MIEHVWLSGWPASLRRAPHPKCGEINWTPLHPVICWLGRIWTNDLLCIGQALLTGLSYESEIWKSWSLQLPGANVHKRTSWHFWGTSKPKCTVLTNYVLRPISGQLSLGSLTVCFRASRIRTDIFTLFLSLLRDSNARVPCEIKITNLAESTNCPKEAFKTSPKDLNLVSLGKSRGFTRLRDSEVTMQSLKMFWAGREGFEPTMAFAAPD